MEVSEQWQKLISEWNILPNITRGMGENGQVIIDKHYEDMKEYVEKNPRYKLPEKWICSNDGSMGIGSGLTEQIRNTQECNIQ